MTALAANITDTQTLIPVDAGLTNGSFQLPLYYTVDSEAIRVTGRAHRTTWLVERGIAGTTAASHSSAATLTRYYPEAATGGAGAGGVTVDNQSDPPATITTIIAPAAMISGDEATIPVQQGIEIEATGATAVEINLTAQTEDGNAAILGEAYSENSQGSINLAAGGGNEEASLDLAASDGGGSLATLNATNIGFYGVAATPRPEVPASPTEQDIVDALVLLGLVTQAA